MKPSAIHSSDASKEKKMKHGDASEIRGTKSPSLHFYGEAVTRRSTRRLSRIAKGL